MSSAGEKADAPAAPATIHVASKARLNRTALTIVPQPNLLACIDFGTAFSKAAVWQEGEARPIPLDLEQAGAGQAGFTIPSSIYITNGSVYFGARALEESRRENNLERERFDSPKQCLSIDDPNDIDRERLSAAIDPTNTFSRGDLLRLYLAYLTSCMAQRLEAHNLPRHTARRFAIPVWRGDQLASASALLRRSLAEAQVIADSLDADVWGKGISVPFAKQILIDLGEIPEEQTRNAAIVQSHVLEPMAAAAGITDHVSNQKPRILVADIGAGTSDFGAYQFVLPGEGRARAHPFAGSESALKQAGNRLDEFLIHLIVERSGTPAGSDAAARITKYLMRNIRETKQTLFTAGQAFVSVPDLFDVTVALDEFAANKHVQQFVKTFKDHLVKTIELAGAKNFTERDVKKYAILTGGGAMLPMIRNLFDEPFEVSTGNVRLQLVDPTPDWVLDVGGDVLGIFPQLAVSAGGASPNLVEERMPVTDVTNAPKRVLPGKWG
jgi:molecular chaperone HscA